MNDYCYMGEIRMFGGSYVPSGWAFCEGQLFLISQNQALFSILGTMYGGDGRTTFGLPDLRGRSAVGVGDGPGLSNVSQGLKGGEESVNLGTTETGPAGRSGNIAAVTTTNVPTQSPFLGVRYIICLNGIFPSRT